MTAILIPLSGPLHVFEIDSDPEQTLARFDGKGPLAHFHLEVDRRAIGDVYFLHDTTGPVNGRARRALAAITQIHMVLVGPVMFANVERDVARDVVAMLSMKEVE